MSHCGLRVADFFLPIVLTLYFYKSLQIYNFEKPALSFKLESDCLQQVLVSAVQWSESSVICIHISPPSWTPHPTPLGRHRAQGWSPCAIQWLPTSCLFYTWQCIHVSPNLPIHPTLPFRPCVHASVLTSVSLTLKGLLFSGQEEWHWNSEPSLWFFGEGNGNPLQYSYLKKKSHGQRSLVGYGPWDHRELDTTEPPNNTTTLMCVLQRFKISKWKKWFKWTFLLLAEKQKI